MYGGRRGQDLFPEVKEDSVTGRWEKIEGERHIHLGRSRGTSPPPKALCLDFEFLWSMEKERGKAGPLGKAGLLADALQNCPSRGGRLTTVPRAVGPGSCLLMG